MKHLALPLVVVLALLAGCKDKPRQMPTEPGEAVESAVKAPEREAPQGAESTLCAAYRTQLGESRAALERAPGDESLQEAVATYQAVIADACP